MRLILLFLVIFQFLACDENNQANSEKNDYVNTVINKVESEKLWRKAIYEGDFKAYNEISNSYLLNDRPYELYYYSLIMANRHNCPEAYYNLFEIMNDKVEINGVKLYSEDSITRTLSLYYLLKSKELGFKKAEYDVYNYFGDSIRIPQSIKYLKKLEKFH